MSAEHTHDEHASEHEGMTKKKIWQVFFYLLGITAVEFFIALYLIPKGILGQGIGNFSYIVLTLVKAFYIVAYFMHLKFENLLLRLMVGGVFLLFAIVIAITFIDYYFR